MSQLLALLTLLFMPFAAGAATVKDGALLERDAARVRPLLGDYEGQWNSDLISRYALEQPILRLRMDADRRLGVVFFMDADAAAQNDALDLLGFGCQSRVGRLLKLKLEDVPATPGVEPDVVLDATFDFDWGRCPARVHAVASNDLRLRIAVDGAERAYIALLALLRSVQGDSRVYVEADGARREVVVRKKEGGRGSVYAPDLEYCVTNDLGEIERCFERESEVKRYIVPFPFPGLSAAWYTKKSPKLEFEKGTKLVYHEGVFRRRYAE
jgi:hypothetical protein